MYLVLLGLPGVGKGTYSKKLVDQFNFHHFSIGDILREKNDPSIKECIDKGNLIPTSFLLKILEEFLSNFKNKNIIFDGIPRSVEQFEIIENFLNKIDKKIDLIIRLKMNKESIIDRILYRITCSNCKMVYNLKFYPSLQTNLCNICNNTLVRREDDKKDTILKRIEVYEKYTSPLIKFYKEKDIYKDIFREINVDKDTSIIWKEIERIIKEKL